MDATRRKPWMVLSNKVKSPDKYQLVGIRILMWVAFYKVHPVLCPSGHPADVLVCSIPTCLSCCRKSYWGTMEGVSNKAGCRWHFTWSKLIDTKKEGGDIPVIETAVFYPM
jgi:hypothetical protein